MAFGYCLECGYEGELTFDNYCPDCGSDNVQIMDDNSAHEFFLDDSDEDFYYDRHRGNEKILDDYDDDLIDDNIFRHPDMPCYQK